MPGEKLKKKKKTAENLTIIKSWEKKNPEKNENIS